MKANRLWVSSILVATLLLSACSGATKNGASNEGAGSAEEQKLIEVTMVRSTDDNVEKNILGGLGTDETLEDNRWLDLFKEEAGVSIKYNWIAKGGEQYTQKLRLSLATGDIPDMLEVNAGELKQLVESDLIQPLDGLYEEYATPKLREEWDKAQAGFDMATFDGKLYGFPVVWTPYDSREFLWIRTDWLNKLGLQPPKTVEEMLNVAKAFKEQDPDGNGVDDTLGLGLAKDIFGGGHFTAEGFLNGFHASTPLLKDYGSGQLEWSFARPEVLTPLSELARLYEEGIIDREFYVKSVDQVGEDVGQNKIGMFYGKHWAAAHPLQKFVEEAKANDPSVDWRPYPIPSVDNQPAIQDLPSAVGSWWVVKKGFEHPEALIKLWNIRVNDEELDIEHYFDSDKVKAIWNLQPFNFVKYDNNIETYESFKPVLEGTMDVTELRKNEQVGIQPILDYRAGDLKGWSWDAIYGLDSAMTVLKSYIDNNQFDPVDYLGVPTEAMLDLKPVLDQITEEFALKVITGETTVDSWEKYVNDWMTGGGGTYLRDANAWYEQSK